MAESNLIEKTLTETVLSRRSFLKLGATVGGVAALVGSGVKLGAVAAERRVKAAGTETVFRTACNPECNHCALMVHVRNGRAVRVTPDPDFYLRGCARGASRLQWTYHPDRIKYPFKRVGERGSGQWERISWDEALDLVATNLTKIRDEVGPQAVYFISGAVMSALRLFSIGRFSNALTQGKTTVTGGQLCCAAQEEAEVATCGYRFGAMDNLADAKLMICWGHNPAVTYTPHWRYIADGLDKGMKLITIDPRFSETASKSDDWLPIKPGTDPALAFSMMHVIISERLWDNDFVMNKTNLPFLVNVETGKLVREVDLVSGGDPDAFLVWDQATEKAVQPDMAADPALDGEFEVSGMKLRTVFAGLKERAANYEPAAAAEITGVPAEKIIALAREYATNKPALINSMMSGAQRTSYGEYVVATMVYLCALTGNLGVVGSGLNDLGGPLVHGTLDVGGFLFPFPPNPQGMIPCTKFGEYILDDKPYPVKAVVWQGAGAGQIPNSEKVKAALKKLDFVVVLEHFMTDAAEMADVILPAATLFEYYDIMASHVNYYYTLIDKGIDYQWEAKSDLEIYSALAQKMGFGEYFDKTDEEWVNFLLKPTGLTTQELREKGPAWEWGDARRNIHGVAYEKPPFVFFEKTPFKTPSGRLEVHSTRWEGMGKDPMADYIPPDESPFGKSDLAKKYPLQSVNAKIRTKVHSTFALMPWLTEFEPEPWVDINPEDAATRGISTGDMVSVFNDRGSVTVKARVNPGIRTGVISVQNGWWVKQGGNASVLSNDGFTMAYGHTLNSTLVEVRKA